MMRTYPTVTLTIFLLTTALAPCAAADPTRPPTPDEIRAWYGEDIAHPGETRWRLQSVLLGEERGIAIINDRRVRVGDSIGNARVKEIEPYRVLLVDENGEVLVLNMATRRVPSGPYLLGN